MEKIIKTFVHHYLTLDNTKEVPSYYEEVLDGTHIVRMPVTPEQFGLQLKKLQI